MAVGELGGAEAEAVAPDDQARAGRRPRSCRRRSPTFWPAVGSYGRELAGDPEPREGDVGGVDDDEPLVVGAGRVVADHDAGGAQCGDVGDDRLERGDPQAPLAGRLDAEVAAEQAEHVDGEVEGADDADQVDGDAAALLGGARPGGRRGALPPKARLARSTPTAMVSTTMPSAKPKSARPMLGPWRVSGPRAIGPSGGGRAGRRGVDGERLGLDPRCWRCRRRRCRCGSGRPRR